MEKLERLNFSTVDDIKNFLTLKKFMQPTDQNWNEEVNKCQEKRIKSKGELYDYLLKEGVRPGTREMDSYWNRFAKNLPLR